jgi:non-ribosomal peptide synthetase component F
LTYRQLDEHANAIAEALVQAGVPKGAVVALRLRRSTDLIAAPLGVMKADCVYLPLDPAMPEQRTRFMVADSGAVALLVRGCSVSCASAGPGWPGDTMRAPS